MQFISFVCILPILLHLGPMIKLCFAKHSNVPLLRYKFSSGWFKSNAFVVCNLVSNAYVLPASHKLITNSIHQRSQSKVTSVAKVLKHFSKSGQNFVSAVLGNRRQFLGLTQWTYWKLVTGDKVALFKSAIPEPLYCHLTLPPVLHSPNVSPRHSLASSDASKISINCISKTWNPWACP